MRPDGVNNTLAAVASENAAIAMREPAGVQLPTDQCVVVHVRF
jgi:hypothetical protein